ncbi:SRPBCC family protein [Flindersiella endophytica]
MRLDHSFTVPAPVDEAWAVLLDVPRIAPCMPGAALESFDGESFTGTVKVKLGPVSLTYRGKGRFVSSDEAAHRVVIEASGREARGSGTAAATVTASMEAEDDALTRVDVATELKITGRPAQFGRGMLSDVGGKLIGQFADCLEGKLSETRQESRQEAPPEETAAAVGAVDPAADPIAAREPAAAATKSAEEPKPIDLLEVTGAGAMAKKYGPYVLLGLVIVAIVLWLALR